jgi:hypothetical protein
VVPFSRVYTLSRRLLDHLGTLEYTKRFLGPLRRDLVAQSPLPGL